MSNQSDSQAFVYANLVMSYVGQSANGKTLATTSITNTSPILSKPSNYYGMISRLSIDNYTIPLYIPRVVLNQPDVNLLNYQFALGYNGVYSDPIYVEFIPSPDPLDTGYNYTPASPVGNQQDLTTSYYYIYLYSQFLNMWNIALENALINLAGKTTLPVGIEAPIFYFDSSLGLVLKAQTANYGQGFNPTTTVANKVQIYMDGNLAPLCNGMNYMYTDLYGTGNCKFVFILTNLQNNIDSTGDYYLSSLQNISELYNWTSAVSIQLQTNMPVAPEYTQGSIGTQGYGQNQSQTIALLTDFIPDRSVNPATYHTQVVYNKVDSLRLFDLISDSPLKTLSVTLSFIDSYNRIFPMYLSQGQTASIKFEFIRKDVYSNIGISKR